MYKATTLPMEIKVMILRLYIDAYIDELIYTTTHLPAGCAGLIPFIRYTALEELEADNKHRCSKAERRIRALDYALPEFRDYIVKSLQAEMKSRLPDAERNRQNALDLYHGIGGARYSFEVAGEWRVVVHLAEMDLEQ